MGKSSERGNFTIISLGQGQEGPAERVLDKYMAEVGGWVGGWAGGRVGGWAGGRVGVVLLLEGGCGFHGCQWGLGASRIRHLRFADSSARSC